MTAGLPAGYVHLSRHGVRGFAWEGAGAWLEITLERHGTLEAWAAGHDGVEIGRGRGGVRALPAPVPGPEGRSRWVVRHYRRGGWAARALGDRYGAWGTERPFLELDASAVARARGVRSPAVVAGAAYRTGLVYRADLVTEEVAGAPSLATRLRGAPTGHVVEDDLLRRAGRAVGSLERARVLHADMSAGNILLGPEGPAWIVDLDRAAVLPPDTRVFTVGMRQRLERSIRKLCAARGHALPESGWAALRAGYEDEHEEAAGTRSEAPAS